MGLRSNKLFTYTRRWDQKAEGHLKEIEDAFQDLAEKIIVGNRTGLNPTENHILTEFFLSWWARANLIQIGDQKLRGIIGPSRSLSIDEHEELEAAGILTIRDDSTVAGNRIAWMLIRLRMDRELNTGAYRSWGVLSAENGEFGLADHPVVPAIPLTPKKILFLNARDQDVCAPTVIDYNKQSAKGARLYFTGKNLEDCIGSELH